ncbi:hypothetical protein TNCV_910831 [Trichonephila clavipes]|uniref:Uncharacterized protein n=1 Tax=Trichonephila clavipes TaxID=2585209 RepID=A0A8X7BEM2_TRICX|nr:hypothetical protein TNCV_910831 [Trichonephila clavipes]
MSHSAEALIVLDVYIRLFKALTRRFTLGIWTVQQSSIPYQDKSLMLGMTKVVVCSLLSGMTAIGRTMGSGRRVYGSSSGRKSS